MAARECHRCDNLDETSRSPLADKDCHNTEGCKNPRPSRKVNGIYPLPTLTWLRYRDKPQEYHPQLTQHLETQFAGAVTDRHTCTSGWVKMVVEKYHKSKKWQPPKEKELAFPGDAKFKLPAKVPVPRHDLAVIKNPEEVTVEVGDIDDKAEFRVITNYVLLEQFPQTLYQYSILYNEPDLSDKIESEKAKLSREGKGKGKEPAFGPSKSSSAADGKLVKMVKIIKNREEKARVRQRLEELGVLDSNTPWASNGESVWSTKPLFHAKESSDVKETKDLEILERSGHVAVVPAVKISRNRRLTVANVDKPHLDLLPWSRGESHDRPANFLTPALNAFIAKFVQNSCYDDIVPFSGRVAAAGANKFYMKAGHEDLIPEESRAQRNPHNAASQHGGARGQRGGRGRARGQWTGERVYLPNQQQQPQQPRLSGLVALRGYYLSVRPGTEMTLLNINPVTSAFIKPILVSEFIKALQSAGLPLKAIEPMLIGKSARITYERKHHNKDTDPDPNRYRTVSITGFGRTIDREVNWTKLPDGTFKANPVIEYFEAIYPDKVYKLDRTDPCVNVGHMPKKDYDNDERKHKARWMPAQCLEIEPNQPLTDILPDELIPAMTTQACRPPAVNFQLILKEGLPKLGLTTTPEFLRSAGFQVGSELLAVPAKLLDQFQIKYADSAPKQDGRSKSPFNASWDLRDVRFARIGSDLSRLAIVHLQYGDETFDGHRFARQLAATLQGHGINVTRAEDPVYVCKRITLTNDSFVQSVEEALDTFIASLKGLKGGVPSVVLVVLPDSSPKVYGAVKKVADTQLGQLTICTAFKTALDKGKDPQVRSNLALKFNFKLGGSSHEVCKADGSAFDLNGTDTIVLGADVTHPGKGDAPGTPSIACVVGSIDDAFVEFPGSMRLQRSRKEMITDMASMVSERLLAWAARHPGHGGLFRLPKNVIMFRDGVSESQYAAVTDYELKSIAKGYEDAAEKLKLDGNGKYCDSKIAFTVVGKRHHTRFLAMNKKESYKGKLKPSPDAISVGQGKGRHWEEDGRAVDGKNGNVRPGTVVDKVITHPVDGDFYLTSHNAIQGTARSGHYYPVYNQAPPLQSAKALQELAYRMCYSYSPATKGISYCAPAYYADKLCTRGRCYLAKWDSEPALENLPLQIPKGQPERDAFLDYVASSIQDSPFWSASQSGPVSDAGRKNPWTPALDNVMFYA